jgi:hypothetical protein
MQSGYFPVAGYFMIAVFYEGDPWKIHQHNLCSIKNRSKRITKSLLIAAHKGDLRFCGG